MLGEHISALASNLRLKFDSDEAGVEELLIDDVNDDFVAQNGPQCMKSMKRAAVVETSTEKLGNIEVAISK